MTRKSTVPNVAEKERIRSEIDHQIEEYINNGGQIDVVSSNNCHASTDIGSVWRNNEEVLNLLQE